MTPSDKGSRKTLPSRSGPSNAGHFATVAEAVEAPSPEEF